MKRIFLARHAQALPAENGDDFSRKLSPKGLSDAFALGQNIKKLDLIPDHILCSSALRTQETCKEILKGLEHNIHTEFLKSIYNAGPGELFNLIQNANPTAHNLLVVAHNPTIYELAVKLASKGPEQHFHRLSQGYAPASLSVFETNIDDWKKLDPNACGLSGFMDPLDYNAPERPTRWT